MTPLRLRSASRSWLVDGAAVSGAATLLSPYTPVDAASSKTPVLLYAERPDTGSGSVA